jgi:hypothetical protein
MKINHFAATDMRERERIIVKAQNMLAEHYPASRFTVRADNFESMKIFWADKMLNPHLMVAECEDCLVFFKKYDIINEHDKVGELKRALKADHVKYGDCIFVDFAVAVASDKNEEEIRAFFLNDPSAKFILGARKGVAFLLSTREAEVIAARAKSLNFILETVN